MSLSKAAAKLSKPLALKPTRIPHDMIAIIDTREQQPLFTPPPLGLTCHINTLPHGDYSIKGFEHAFAIERKKQSDLWTYCSSEMDTRTRRKMEQFNAIVRAGGFVGLVIEAAESDLMGGYMWSKGYNPEVVRGAICSFEIGAGVNVYYSRDRADIERWVLDRMARFYITRRGL